MSEVTAAWHDRLVSRVVGPASDRARDRALDLGERVVAATRDLVIEHDGTGFPVQEIAKRANTSLATLYAHFGGKDEILLAVFEGENRTAAAWLANQLTGVDDRVERLRRVVRRPVAYSAEPAVRRLLVFRREEGRLAEIFPEAVWHSIDPIISVIDAEIRSAVAAGRAQSPDPRADANAIYQLMWTSSQSVLLGWFPDAKVAADQLWSFCRRALHIDSDTETERQPS
jgi:AcrR family transcriptional regulator